MLFRQIHFDVVGACQHWFGMYVWGGKLGRGRAEGEEEVESGKATQL